MDINDLIGGKAKKQSSSTATSNTTTTTTTSSEDDVLASLGTTRAETSSYESDVLRQATHKLAPELQVKDPGFPDFITETSLLPFSTQKQGKANRQVVLSVLQSVQNQLSTGMDNLDQLRLLQMKQHILLSMLGQHSPKPAIQHLWKRAAALELSYEQAERSQLRHKRVRMMQRKQIVPGTTSLKSLQTNRRKNKSGWKDWSSEEEEDDDPAPPTRPVLAEMNVRRRTPVSRKKAQPRSTVSAMSHKNRRRPRRVPQNSKDDDVIVMEPATAEETEFDLRRRPQRNRTTVASYAEHDNDSDKETMPAEAAAEKEGPIGEQKREIEASATGDEKTTFEEETGTEDNINDQEEEKVAVATEPLKDPQGQEMIGGDAKMADMRMDDTTKTNPSNETTSTTDNGAATAKSTSVTCPLCQQTVTTSSDPSQADSELAQHMTECQSPSRRSSRRRNQPTNGYAELKYEEELETVPSRSKRKRSDTEEEEMAAPFTDSIETSNKDDTFEFDAEVSDEAEEELQEDIMDEDIPLTKPTAVDDYLLDDYEDRVDYWRLHGVSEMRDMSKLRAEGETDPGPVTLDGGLHIPAWMNNRLFAYQRTGLEWMWTLHQQQAGGVMGDEMGLGKTVQVSSFLGAMSASRQLKGVLIISPATILQHWLTELAVWAPGLRRVLIHSSGDSNGSSWESRDRSLVNQAPAIFRNLRTWLKSARKERLYERIDHPDGSDDDEPADSFCGTGYAVVTTYEHVRRNQDDYVNHPWSYIVMDEAQKIRNPHADITLACKRLRTPHRIAMTGTPIQNDLKELWSLFDFVFPGRLGTLPAFDEEFAGPIKRGGYSNASPVQVQLAYRCSLVLRDLIDPYLLRRQKAEIDEVRRMPSKTEHVLFCRLSKRQRRMYESFLQSDMVKKIFKGSTLLFAAVTMLRKICNHPDLVLSDPSDDTLEAFLRNGCVPEESLQSDEDDEEADEYDPFPDTGDRLEERSGKFEVMAKILPLWKQQGHRVLIFSQWTKMLNIIQQFVVAQGWKFLRLDGKTNVASRQKLVDQFNRDKSCFGMLCTTRTGGVGLNLTGANKLILYDVDWNPQTDAQARERAWRFGQEKQVTVYRLCTAGTIEEKMYQRQIFKTALTNKVLHDPRQKRLFSQKDLHDLLTLQPDNGTARSGGDEGIETTERLAKASQHDGGVGASEVSTDDGETLESVLKSKGLAGVFDHNFVDPSSSGGNKTASVREMEAQAKKIAQEAAEALRSSVETDDPFTPTWTGAPESRFGGGSGSGNGKTERRSSFGSAGTAGVRNTGGGSKSSGSLLASIRNQNEAIKSGGRRSSLESKNGKYTQLMVQIRDYVKKHSPTSDEILDAFASVPNCDAAIFKRLLNSVARKEEGHWKVLPERG